MSHDSFLGPEMGIQISDQMVANVGLINKLAIDQGWSWWDLLCALTLSLEAVKNLKSGADLGLVHSYLDVDDADLISSGGFN